MTNPTTTDSRHSKVRHGLRVIALGALCLVLPQMFGSCLIEPEVCETRHESQVAVHDGHGADESRGSVLAVYLPREPRCRVDVHPPRGVLTDKGHRLPGGQSAPLTC